MPGNPSVRVMEQLRAAAERDGPAPTDGELLGQFADRHDDSALALLVRRHGPMVWGVCRRMLAHHDAEDAFQATFLVLVCKASGVRPREQVAGWLYGVAHRTALMARRTAARRRTHERQAAVPAEAAGAAPPDAAPFLDQELSRLPDRYRTVLVLCDLEGRTRTEVASQLGVPEGTVAGRLARARALLARRLGGAWAAAVVAVPEALAEAAMHAASRPVSAEVMSLSTQVVRAMTGNTLKAVAAVVLGVLAAGTLAVGLAVGKPPPQERAKAPDDPAERLVGTWTVKFENEVNEWCRVSKDRTAKVVEPQRRSPGKVEVRDGSVLIVYDDDRLERWTPVGDGAVVEHWCPASAYPKEKAVKGIAERTTADEPPPHFVEKPDLKPQFDWLPLKVEGEVTEESIYVASKGFIADIRNPGKIRFRDFIDPRYLQKHGLTDKDIAYEIGDNTGLRTYQVADDLRTILFVVDAKGGGKELIVVRWVLHDGRLYLSPTDPDPKTGVFKFWILRTKLSETKPPPPPAPNDKPSDKPPHVVEKPDMKGRMESGQPQKLGRDPTEEDVRAATKMFFSKMGTYPDYRFREFFDPQYLKKHGLTDKDIAFEVVSGYCGLHDYVVAADNRTILCTLLRTVDGKELKELFLLRWVYHDGCLYVSPEKAPDPKTDIFTPWILRAKP